MKYKYWIIGKERKKQKTFHVRQTIFLKKIDIMSTKENDKGAKNERREKWQTIIHVFICK